MKRLSLRWIIGLMGLSMIGLIAFQFYWINGLVEANEERFKKDVIEALNNVASKLEKQETIATYNRLNQLNLSEERERKQQAIVKQERLKNQNPSVEKAEVKSDQKPVARTQEMYAFFDTIQFGNDFQFVISGGMSQFYYQPGYTQNSGLNESSLQQEEEIRVLEDQLDRVSRKYELTLNVMKDLTQPARPLASRFNAALLDTLLRSELENKGIDMDYDYGIISPQFRDSIVLTNQEAKEDLDQSELRASLFPNDVFENNSHLVIDFPEKEKFLINKIWSSLFSSAFLVVVILFCFGYSIKTIVDQKKLSAMKNDFINNMTHELKTPIATVSLAVEALNDKDIEGSKLRERYLNVISDENKRLGDQVEKVLQIAAIDKRDYNLKEELLMMNEVVRDAAEHISMQIEQRGGRLNLIENADQDLVKGDRTHLTNIVLNLLDNANKYSPDSPNITLRTETTADFFNLTVQDRGLGMTKEQQKHIFQKFYRVPTGDRHDVKGFGLGLAYVHSMVQAHGGAIDVESEPGKGSKFLITLPLTNEA